ncbi:MAG: hypothetical protein A2X46_08720 [Lentisphaerae bacterium GWF2_57_35]|nr:MAG: hypothetical protein A2X46_08720 [Lentisphaerae bacterium GWF2_57_35]
MLMRRLKPSDVSKLGRFFERNDRLEMTRYFNPFTLTMETAARLLRAGSRDQFFALEKEDVIVGFSMYRGYDEGYITPSFGLMIDCECQGQGLGRKLTEWTLRWADQTGVAKVRLTVFVQNEPARHLYEELGFKETGRDVHPTGGERLVMHRERRNRQTSIYASTQCQPSNDPVEQRLCSWADAGILRVELSNYSVPNESSFFDVASTFPGKLMLHHFFPAGHRDLVLNLASADKSRRDETLQFFMRSLEWSARLGAAYFSFHAGYISDPVARDDHGFVLAPVSKDARRDALDRFVKAVSVLEREADMRGIRLLVENNVAAGHNSDKLLLVTPDDFDEFFGLVPASSRVGILLDWGHWMVSAQTRGGLLEDFLRLRDRIGGMHLHTNNGLGDTHEMWPSNHPDMEWLRKLTPSFISLEGRYSSMEALQAGVLEMERLFP